jgi:SAM-dependent methyltransferase
MDEALYEEMYQMEIRHWWFAAKHRIVLALLDAFLAGERTRRHEPSTQGVRVADLGCGCGAMLTKLAALGYDAVGVDTSDLALEFCRARGVSVVKGHLPGDVDLPGSSLDAVLMLDVLEHIEDDRAALASAVTLGRPGAVFICTVPAYSWLWTTRDEFHHHKRRYSRAGLVGILRSVGALQILHVSFMNTVLFPLALTGRLLARATKRHDVATDLTIPRFGLNSLLEGLFAAERHLLARRLYLPFGLSLVAVARKAGAAAGDGG